MFRKRSQVKIRYNILDLEDQRFQDFYDLEAVTSNYDEAMMLSEKFDKYARQNKTSKDSYALVVVDDDKLEIIVKPPANKWTYENAVRKIIPMRKYYPDLKMLCANKEYPDGYEKAYAKLKRNYNRFIKKKGGHVGYIRPDKVEKIAKRVIKKYGV